MRILRNGTVKTAEDRFPSQLVLSQVRPGTYATHIRVIPPDREPYLILGQYFFSKAEAEASFRKRDRDLNNFATLDSDSLENDLRNR